MLRSPGTDNEACTPPLREEVFAKMALMGLEAIWHPRLRVWALCRFRGDAAVVVYQMSTDPAAQDLLLAEIADDKAKQAAAAG